MGILQKQSPYAHISFILSKLDGRACILSYVIGFAWFMALAHHKLNAPTYFSENALLPGLVESEFYSDYGAEGYNKELKQLLIDQENTDKMYEIPTGWLTQKFQSLGIDTYVQKYSFRYPFGIYQGKNLTGRNVYGIMRAPRSPGTEALVLSVPFRPELSKEQATYPGIALMLALARAFRRHSYWAKDVIFLVTDNEEIGIQAWLSSYHHAPNKYISAGVLPSRSGSIQAAINLEMPSASLGRVNVKFEGLNGKLPNLDLINTVERLFIREGLKITIQEKSRELGINEWSRYLHSLKTMLSMVWHQAPGTPTGNHGYFHKYNIEAVTIQGMKGKVKKPFEFSDTGRVLEGIFRSLNNLLERFHQSFFFYLLPSPNRYVSIGVYMPPFGVMVLPIVIKALASWISLSGDPIADETKKGKHETEGQFKSSEENVTTEVTEQQSKDSNPSPDKPVSSVISDAEPKRVEDFVTTEVVEQQSNQSPDESVSATIPDDENRKGLDKLSHVTVFLISLLTGVGSFYAADFFVESAHKFDLTQEEGLAIGFLVTHVLAMLQPFIFKRQVLKGLNGTLKLDRNFLNCFTLLFFGISIGTISVMNISMAFLVAAAWVPVIFVNKATNFRLLAVLKYLVIICVSPFSLLFIGCMVNQVLAGFSDNLLTLLGKAWTDLQDGLMLSAFQFYLSDNWTFPLLNFVFLPIWSLFWFVATVD